MIHKCLYVIGHLSLFSQHEHVLSDDCNVLRFELQTDTEHTLHEGGSAVCRQIQDWLLKD